MADRHVIQIKLFAGYSAELKRSIHRYVNVCAECANSCEGLKCEHLDWDEHVFRERHDDGDCPHCGDSIDSFDVCDASPPESHCYDCENPISDLYEVVGHVCWKCEICYVPDSCMCMQFEVRHYCMTGNTYLCLVCRECGDCVESCCNFVYVKGHLADAHALTLKGEVYSCRFGHRVDRKSMERLLARHQMQQAGVPELI